MLYFIRKQKAATQPVSTPREPRVDEEAALATNLALSEVEANSNGTNESAILDTNETGNRLEEEIDLNNVPESHATTDENPNGAWVGESSGAATETAESAPPNDNNGGNVNNTEYVNEDEYEYVYDDGEGGGEDGEYEYEYVYEDEHGNIIEGEYANEGNYDYNYYNNGENNAYDNTGYYANSNEGDAHLVNNDGNSASNSNRH